MKKAPRLELTPEQRKIAEELGRIGGKTRAKNLSAEQRRAIALRAGKAAGKAHKERAKQRKSKERKKH